MPFFRIFTPHQSEFLSFIIIDPDIMMIGEIRDEETADMTLRAAQIGHLVLTTLHTNDSVGMVPLLRTLGMGSGLIADCLLGALSQRLVRLVCKDCKVDAEANGYAQEIFHRLDQLFPLVHGQGCEKCRNTGYRGRIGIYELFVVNQEAADLISAKTPGHEIRQFAREQGMRSLFDDALDKVKAGITTFSELRRNVPYRIITEPLADRWVKE